MAARIAASSVLSVSLLCLIPPSSFRGQEPQAPEFRSLPRPFLALEGSLLEVRPVFVGKDRALTSGTGWIKIGDTSTGALVRSIEHGLGTARNVVASPDGSIITAGFGNHERVRVWEADSGKELAGLPGHEVTPAFVTFSADGKQIATVSFRRILRVWDAKTLQLLGTHGTVPAGYFLCYSPDGKLILTGNGGPVIYLDPLTGKSGAYFEKQEYGKSLAFSQDGKWAAIGDDHGNVGLWDVETKKPVWSAKAHDAHTNSLHFAPNGKRVYSLGQEVTRMPIPGGVRGSVQSSICAFDVKTGKREFGYVAGEKLISISVSPDGKTLALGAARNLSLYPLDKLLP
jgi:WD40 repeat protein